MNDQIALNYVRSALFVDFDNIYLRLLDEDEDVAEKFARNPDRWLAWLEKKLPSTNPSNKKLPRRILVKRCYLNPESFSEFRPYFTRSGFEVVDCPPLTGRKKTSTDIHMAVDILDALDYKTFFHEFIILSGDADFTPVVFRLSKNDRRSVILAIGFASTAYKAACDSVIDQDSFIKYAVGVEEEDEATEKLPAKQVNDATVELLQRMADRVYEKANVAYGILSNELPRIYKEFEEFISGEHWLGFYSLKRLTEEIVAKREDLIIIEEDPWRVARIDDPSLRKVQDETIPAAEKSPGQDIKQDIADLVIGIVQGAKSKVPMASLALAVQKKFGEHIESGDWLGSGSFKNLLLSLDLGDLKILNETPGHIYDASQGNELLVESAKKYQPTQPFIMKREAEFMKRFPDMAPLAKKISQLTDTPYLLPEDFGLLLREVAREVNDRGYNLNRTSKIVRDRCVERGAPISRADVHFVLRGVTYAGYRFSEADQEQPEELGHALYTNVLNLSKTAQLSLNAEEKSRIKEWITSKISA